VITKPIRELAPGTMFSPVDHPEVIYIMHRFHDLNHEKSFLLENVKRKHVFESLMNPDTLVIVRG
jgi:hypothetical protein